MNRLVGFCVVLIALSVFSADEWPDGMEIDPWFGDVKPVDVATLGKAYRLNDNFVFPDGETHTREIQVLIDRAAKEGGGVIVVPPGVYRTGSLFFRPGVHLRLEEGAVLFGSDNPLDYPIVETRIEGACRKFVAALVNADGCDGFTVTGPGTVDGNGYRAWRSAVMRHQWSDTAVNLDEQRARLLYVARSKNVRIENVRLQNPQFWTQHFWDCENVKLVGVTVYSPNGPEGHVKSCTDALDLDETRNVLVKNCRFGNYDDAVSLKGNEGAAVENVLIEDTEFGFCHGALVLGSEARRVRNVLMRRCTMDHAMRVLWIKFRADMRQHYDYVTVEDVKGTSEWFFFARQFSDNRDLRTRLSEEELAARRSVADHFTMRNCRIDSREFFHLTVTPDVGSLSDFSFTDLDVRGENIAYDLSGIERCVFRDVKLAERPWTGCRHGVGPIKRASAVKR